MWDLLKRLPWPLSFKRQYAQPLDYDAVFETLADMQTYLTDPVRYQGQVATCLESEGKIYHLNSARDAWVEISGGGSTESDILLKSNYENAGVVAGQTQADYNLGVDTALSNKQDSFNFVSETNNEYLRDDGTFKVIEMPVGGYANNLYFNETTSDVNGYETLSYTPESNTTIESWLVNASEGEKVLKSYLYPSQVGVNYLNSGLWSFQFYGKVSAANDVTNLGVQYFRRLTDNSEVNLFTLWSDEINNTSDAWIKISTTLPGYNLETTDRMGCRVLARTTHNQNITINYAVGDGYGAWINNPNKIRHSQLRALNEDLTAQHVDSSTVKTTPINADGLALWDSVALKFVKTGLSNFITFLSDSFALKSFLQGNYNDSKELTGFISPEFVVVTGNNANRTVILTGAVSAKWCGNAISEIVSGWTSAAHPSDNTKSYFLYFDGTNFIWSENIWEFYHLQICKAIYINNEWVYVRETHGLMQWQVHKELHERIKSYITKNTGLVTGFVVGSTTAAARRPVVSQVQINDEDLPTLLAAITTNSYTRCYLSGAGNGTANFETAQTEITRLSGNQPYYNQFTSGLWQQTLLANNAHTCIWLVGMPMAADSASQKYRLLWMQGQSTGTLAEMTARTPNDLNIQALKVANEEICVFAKLIIKYTASNWQIASAVTYYTTSDSGTGGTTSVSGLATVAYSGLHADSTNKNSEDSYQHIDNTTLKSSLIDNDKVSIYDSVTSKYISILWQNFKSVFVNLTDLNVSSWVNGEQRLLLARNNNGVATFDGAAELLDIYAPPANATTLLVDSGWSNEQKTLTGNNTLGQLGKVGQIIWLDNKTFCQVISATYTSSASVTYYRNRCFDNLDASTSTQDSIVLNNLDPSYTYPTMTATGNSTDLGWDLATQTKILTVAARVGTWAVGGLNGEGYTYMCFKASGSNTYWKRSGNPSFIQREITASSHPNLVAALRAYDFTLGKYTQSGLETSYQDQTFSDDTNGYYYIKTDATKWTRFDALVTPKKVTLTNAQIKALATTPITLIPQSASGYVHIVRRLQLKLNAGTDVLTLSADSDLRVRYASAASGILDIETTGLLDQSASTMYTTSAPTQTFAYSIANNKAVEILNIGTQIAGNDANDATIDILINYTTVKL